MEKSEKKFTLLLALSAIVLGALLGLLAAFGLHAVCGSASPTAMLQRTVDACIFKLELTQAGEQFQLLSDMAAQERRELRQQEMKARREAYVADFTEELLVLVNPWNEVPEDYQSRLSQVEEGYLLDRRCAAALTQMLYDCREAGNQPVICSAYRTQEYQEELYYNKIMRVLAEGVMPADAASVAARSVAVPGTSEHQLGLAVDIIDENYVNLDKWQEQTAVQQWLMANCVRYGFILRYPNGASETTGIIYEPWHYRYLGPETAQAVTESGLCFEEYLETIKE